MGGKGRSLDCRLLELSESVALSPDTPSRTWIVAGSSRMLELVRSDLATGEGGTWALVGARGSGKSTWLRELATSPGTILLGADVPIEQLANRSSRLETGTTTILVDDAHRFLRPSMDGTDPFETLLATSCASAGPNWLFAFDTIGWPLMERRCEGKSVFDRIFQLEAWTEEQIGELLRLRAEECGLETSFEDLIENLPAGADEIDRREMLANKRSGYERMLWDHVRGNPGLALEVWSSSLVIANGGQAMVQPIRSPDTSALERLPDTSMFVLRCILRFSVGTVEDVALATNLPHSFVERLFHTGLRNGWLETHESGVRITWRWLLEIVRVLERRHMLVNP